ncbi:PIN domain-containing protein [Actinokineospora sp. HUAS TT18]|uniref:PIN domain-containing protein n=1 Tax=Actinokineospora sp. HUAS TT18 TaxID=3447451 RepID=UPI003F51BB3D
MAAVTLAEFLTGIELAEDEQRRAIRKAWLDTVLDVTPVEDYTPDVARHHAALLAHTRRAGQPRGAHDLIIAATARATERVLVSTGSRARFDELPEVNARMAPLVQGRRAITERSGRGESRR